MLTHYFEVVGYKLVAYTLPVVAYNTLVAYILVAYNTLVAYTLVAYTQVAHINSIISSELVNSVVDKGCSYQVDHLE